MVTLALAEPTHINATRIRTGKRADIPAIVRLIHRANAAHPHIDEQELSSVADHGQLIVLSVRPGEVAAAACVASGRGLVFLVIDPEVASPQLEHRMISVADALCEAGGGAARER